MAASAATAGDGLYLFELACAVVSLHQQDFKPAPVEKSSGNEMYPSIDVTWPGFDIRSTSIDETVNLISENKYIMALLINVI